MSEMRQVSVRLAHPARRNAPTAKIAVAIAAAAAAAAAGLMLLLLLLLPTGCYCCQYDAAAADAAKRLLFNRFAHAAGPLLACRSSVGAQTSRQLGLFGQ